MVEIQNMRKVLKSLAFALWTSQPARKRVTSTVNVVRSGAREPSRYSAGRHTDGRLTACSGWAFVSKCKLLQDPVRS
jgi:hypothetical protein